jgi:hypothetical protein
MDGTADHFKLDGRMPALIYPSRGDSRLDPPFASVSREGSGKRCGNGRITWVASLLFCEDAGRRIIASTFGGWPEGRASGRGQGRRGRKGRPLYPAFTPHLTTRLRTFRSVIPSFILHLASSYVVACVARLPHVPAPILLPPLSLYNLVNPHTRLN